MPSTGRFSCYAWIKSLRVFSLFGELMSESENCRNRISYTFPREKYRQEIWLGCLAPFLNLRLKYEIKFPSLGRYKFIAKNNLIVDQSVQIEKHILWHLHICLFRFLNRPWKNVVDSFIYVFETSIPFVVCLPKNSLTDFFKHHRLVIKPLYMYFEMLNNELDCIDCEKISIVENKKIPPPLMW